MSLPFENPVDRSSVYYRAGNDIPNPLWVVKNYKNTSVVNRFFNSTSLNYDFNDNFSVTYRLGLIPTLKYRKPNTTKVVEQV
jgi:hypothetical protein